MHSVGQIFISYSNEDTEYFHKIRTRSSKPIASFWWDPKINRGDPNWRSVTEQAIKECGSIFVLCSPASQRSRAVSAEIELAQCYGKLIYPIWVAGDTWVQSAPFSVITYNYTDLRKWDDQAGLAIDEIINNIVESWPRFFEAPPVSRLRGYCAEALCGIKVDEAMFYFKPTAFDRYLELLQELYSNTLHHHFSNFSYGSEWCLRVGRAYLLPAPWVLDMDKTVTLGKDGYMESPLADLGIAPSTILTLERLAHALSGGKICGLFVSRKWIDLFKHWGLIDGNWIDLINTSGTYFNVVPKELSRKEIGRIDRKEFAQLCYDLSGPPITLTGTLRAGAIYSTDRPVSSDHG